MEHAPEQSLPRAGRGWFAVLGVPAALAALAGATLAAGLTFWAALPQDSSNWFAPSSGTEELQNVARALVAAAVASLLAASATALVLRARHGRWPQRRTVALPASLPLTLCFVVYALGRIYL